MRCSPRIRDFALAAFVIAGVAIIQTAGLVIPSSHVYSFGDNSYGQLGHGTNNSSAAVLYGSAPAGVISKSEFVSVDGGQATSIALSQDGSVYTWGMAGQGRLGYTVTSADKERVPKRVVSLPPTPAIAVSAGESHMLVALEDGTVWSWGASNSNNQLGRGSATLVDVVPGVPNITSVSAGGSFSVALNESGSVYTWGINSSGQAGRSPLAVSTSPAPIPNLPAMSAVSAGGSHALALAADGTVWSWGANTYGQLGRAGSSSGLPQQVGNLANIVMVAATHYASFALDANGTVWGWGREADIGAGSTQSSASAVPRPVTIDGPTGLQPLSNVVHIAGGGSFALAATAGGQVAVWGGVTPANLGLGTSTQPMRYAVGATFTTAITAVAAGSTHGFAVTVDPPITAQWIVPANASCGAVFTADLVVNGYSVAGRANADVMFVLDESGSISASEFTQLKNFVTNFAKTIDIGPGAARVGIAMFADESRLILDPSESRNAVLAAIAGINQAQGYTCIGCGLNEADQSLDAYARSGASRIIIVVTDGANNMPWMSTAQANAHLNAAIANAHADNTVVSVGIGGAIDVDELHAIASDVTGAQMVFTTPDFDSLGDLIEAIAGTVPGPGATNALITVPLPPEFHVLARTPSINGTSTSVTPPSTVEWSVPSLDAAVVKLQLTLRAVMGGVLSLPAAGYADAENNNIVMAPASMNVTGCPAAVALAPASSIAITNTNHTLTATVTDHFGTPLGNIAVNFQVLSGPKTGSLGSAVTNASGVATRTYTSAQPGTDVIRANVIGTALSTEVTHTWEAPNQPPVADAGPDDVVELNGSPIATYLLDGSASTDDGKPSGSLLYSWDGGPFIDAHKTVQLSRGTHVFSLRVSDGELFSAVDTVTITVTDPTAPVVTPSITGTAGNDGWYTSDAGLTWSIADPESHTLSTVGCEDQAVTADTDARLFTCRATNDSGAETASTVMIKRDATPPIVTTSGNLRVAANTAAGATATYGAASATDATSGLASSASCVPASGSHFDMGDTTVVCSATDGAGNVGSSSFVVTVEDLSPPDITAEVTGTAGANGWFTGPVQIVWTVSDPQSSVTATGCEPVTLADDTLGVTITCSATSAGGESSESRTFQVDQQGPALVVPPGINTGTIDPAGMSVTFDASATDATSGVNGSVTCAPASGSTFPIGATPVSCSAADHAGNTSSTSFVIDVRLMDSTPPSIVPSASGTPGSNGWYRGDVAVSFATSDGESAITSSSGCDAATVSSDTAGTTFTCSATSEGGTSTQSITVRRDASAPSLSVSGNVSAAATGTSGAVVNYPAPAASDATSGLDGMASCSPASGSTFAIGSTTVSCSAVDLAGNTASASFTVTVTTTNGGGNGNGNGNGGGNGNGNGGGHGGGGSGNDGAGRMHGEGHVTVDNHRVKFDFTVTATTRRGERGKVEIRISRGRNGRWDDDRFNSRSVSDVVFTNEPSYSPGRKPRSGIDTVVFTGTGKWDKRDHHTYVVRASDRGEPGRGADTFTIEVKAPNGQIVFSGGGTITDGNIQARK